MYAAALLFALVLACGSSDVIQDDVDCQDSSSLCDRMRQVERLVAEQSHLLRQLHSRLSKKVNKLIH